MPNSYLNLTQLGMRFPTPKGEFIALRKVDLRIQEGEFISLIGHSGCGKSTVLNLVAGLHEPTDGGVILQGREVDGPGPERAVVFQHHALLPWLSVYQNVELAVKQFATKQLSTKQLSTKQFSKKQCAVNTTEGKTKRSWVRDQVQHYLELVQMTHASDKMPDEISGGMKQRVGIARALALKPKVLLMDEPFGALDALTRAYLQDALMAIHAELNTTVIMITHDVDEAVLLSDRIVMMTNGPAATIGEVLSVELDRPRNRVQLADDPQYQKYRQSVLRFLYEKQAKPQPVLATPKKESRLQVSKSA
ncbi:ABC transporter ATP-binding protein [Vibrio sp. S9_S30]|uniref:ABC transporter ATP-binding protein n=1 Tax=Vibrio sp. S9_S30 TaxID=2720226 RepID=UPI0016811B54|nr:ABC transporter ATP-binding protein [Vibrio sp. S9_S30]MBD1556406.1 ABC transporter ATP-binding protein [Vibrio sp. S9_S30]